MKTGLHEASESGMVRPSLQRKVVNFAEGQRLWYALVSTRELAAGKIQKKFSLS